MLLFLITQGFVSAQFILRDGYVSDLGMPWSYLWEAQPDNPSWEMRTKSYEPTFGGIRPIGVQIKNGGRDFWATGLGPIWESLGEEKKEQDGRKKMRPSLFSEADLVPPVNMTFVTGKKHDLLYDWGKNAALVFWRGSTANCSIPRC